MKTFLTRENIDFIEKNFELPVYVYSETELQQSIDIITDPESGELFLTKNGEIKEIRKRSNVEEIWRNEINIF